MADPVLKVGGEVFQQEILTVSKTDVSVYWETMNIV